MDYGLLGYLLSFGLGAIFLGAFIYFYISFGAKKSKTHFLKSGNLEAFELIKLGGFSGLEEIKVPEFELHPEKRKASFTQIHIPNPIDLPVKTILFTGDNLSGYYELLLKTLFLIPGMPIFITTRQRDLSRFEGQKNVVLSVYDQKSRVTEQLKKLRFSFYKREITEEEYRKKLGALRSKLESEGKFVKQSKYDSHNYKKIFSPVEILNDIIQFRKHISSQGMVVIGVLEEILSRDEGSGLKFLEQLVNYCVKNDLTLFILLEGGVFDSKVSKRIRFYSDIIFESYIKDGKKHVTMLTSKKIMADQKFDHVSEHFRKIWDELNAS